MKSWSTILASIIGASLAGALSSVITTQAQLPQVSVIGAVTPGNCTKFASTLQLQDNGAVCGTVTNPATSPFTVGASATQNPITLTAGGSGAGAVIGITGASVDTTPFLNVQAKGSGSVNLLDGNGTAASFSAVPSAVNSFNIFGQSTGNSPTIQTVGSDTNVGFNLQSKGTGSIFLGSSSGNVTLSLGVSTTAVNNIQINPSNTGAPPGLAATGSDTNINLALQPKGTGSVALLNGANNTQLAVPAANTIATFPKTSATLLSSADAISTTSAGNPAGTASLSRVMGGVGSTCTFTPTNSTRALVLMTGFMTSNTASDGGVVQLAFGTGTAPANGVAATGTVFGGNIFVQNNANTAGFGFSSPVLGVLSGLTVGTTYWLDFQFAATTGGTLSYNNIFCSAIEL